MNKVEIERKEYTKQERKDFYEYPHSFNNIPSLEIVQIIQTRQEKQEFYTGKKGKRQKYF